MKHKNKPTIVDMGWFFRWGVPAAILGGAWSKPPPCNKLDVADRIAVNICMHHDVLEIDVPTSNVKISKQLMTGEAFLDGAPQLRFWKLRALHQNLPSLQ
jgi:hypothetical protein